MGGAAGTGINLHDILQAYKILPTMHPAHIFSSAGAYDQHMFYTSLTIGD